MILLKVKAYQRTRCKNLVCLVLILTTGNYPKVLTVARIPVQEAEWQEQLENPMKANATMEGNCSTKLSNLLEGHFIIYTTFLSSFVFFCYLIFPFPSLRIAKHKSGFEPN